MEFVACHRNGLVRGKQRHCGRRSLATSIAVRGCHVWGRLPRGLFLRRPLGKGKHMVERRHIVLRWFGSAQRKLVALAVAGLVAAGLSALLPGVASAAGDTVTVHVQQSDGRTGSAASPSTTSAAHRSQLRDHGQRGRRDGSLPDGASCTLTATLPQLVGDADVSITNPAHVTFQTSAVTVSLADHGGGPLAGGAVPSSGRPAAGSIWKRAVRVRPTVRAASSGSCSTAASTSGCGTTAAPRGRRATVSGNSG